MVSASHAAAPLTFLSATDAASRTVLARPIEHWEDGAESPQDIPAAIHRNYPQIIEQNLARMNAADAKLYVDQLSDTELTAMAQLYVNASVDTHRAGSLLLVAANRFDGGRLARLSRFFGYAPVYDAILQAAPAKAQGFAQNAPVVYAAPTPGALTAMSTTVAAAGGGTLLVAARAGAGAGLAEPMAGAFKPNVSMTLQEIYSGFRGMMVGRLAATAALYETTAYAGLQLSLAWGAGYSFGTGLTYLAQTYAPDWYYGTFVDFVGNTYTWFDNTVTTIGGYVGSGVYDLGHYESDIAPVLGVPAVAQQSMRDTGGDFGVTSAWSTYYNLPATCPRGQKCPPPMMH
jgi:hypothetical protein